MSLLKTIQQRALTILVTLFGIELIRLLFPTFVYFLRDNQNISPITLAPIAIGIFALSFLAIPLSRLDLPLAFILTAGGVALFRVLVQLFSTPTGNLFLGAAGVALFLMYLPLALSHDLAIRNGSANFALSLLLGVTVSTAVHSALNTYDLIWQTGFLPLLAVIILALLILLALREHFNSSGPFEPFDLPWRQALSFAAFGPWLFLQLVVFQNVARFSAVSGWPLPAAGLMVTFSNLLGLALALVIIQRGAGGLIPTLGMGLLLIASLFFSESTTFPAGLLPSLGQILSFGLLAALIVNMSNSTAVKTLTHLGLSNGLGQLLLIILSFAYYVSYDISLGFRPQVILPIGGFLLLLIVLSLSGSRQPATVTAIDNTAVLLAPILLILPMISWLSWNTFDNLPILDSNQPIRVINFNVHNGFNFAGQLDLEAIAQVIEESGAEIVGLQEVSRGWVINGSTDMAQWLAQRLEMPYYFGPTEGQLWGNMLLSRYPIIQADHFALPTDSLLLRRGYLIADINTGQQILQVTVTHLYHRQDGSDIRQEQTADLLPNLSNTTALLMGDMNAEPDTPEMALIRQAGWIDVLANIEPVSATYTNSVDEPYRQIDYIWLTADLPFSNPTVIQTQVSDHFPIVVTIGE